MIMKKALILIFCAFWCLSFSKTAKIDDLNNDLERGFECKSNYSAIAIDDSNNRIIYEHKADQIIYPASLTKVMTIYLAFEEVENDNIALNDKIRVSSYAEDISKINRITTLKVKEGDYLTVKDAIKGAAIKSFNEATVLLAEKISGDEWSFANKMNKKAEQLNMRHTNFRNSSGLHEPGQYSTVYDLARLLIAIRKDFPQRCKYFSEKRLVCNDRTYFTHNLFLKDYEGATGFKTGYTSIAGYNLMATATRGDKSLTAVIAACDTSKSRNDFMAEIFDKAFKVIGQDDGEIKVEIMA